MMVSPAAQIWVLALGFGVVLWSVAADGPTKTIGEEDACADFAVGKQSGSAWTLADCTAVWDDFVDTVPHGLQRRQRIADNWRETGMELRRRGSPCLATSVRASTGVGSTIVRLLASWVFAEEMGCDWLKPDWGTRHLGRENATVLYCHQAVNIEETNSSRLSGSALEEMTHCLVVDWIDYFQLGVPSVAWPKGTKSNIIKVDSSSLEIMERAKLAVNEASIKNQPLDRVLFTFELNFASRHLAAVANWDEERRHTVRNVIGQARENFHRHPRPWYDEAPECAFDPARLNFAIHVRMGDRRYFLGESLEYFDRLEAFMETVSEEVIRRGLEPPLFHVFSETVMPCPSEDEGLFYEFPTWPVKKVPECLTAKTPDDCLEKQAGYSCSPERSGIFYVTGMPLVLHLGQDVRNAISCMIQADGLLMGCSTFGQLAGLLSKSISFFSMHCSGNKSPIQYRTTPPIAVAERGHLWVPVTGSWQDPVLHSTEILKGALDTLLGNR